MYGGRTQKASAGWTVMLLSAFPDQFRYSNSAALRTFFELNLGGLRPTTSSKHFSFLGPAVSMSSQNVLDGYKPPRESVDVEATAQQFTLA